MNIGKTNQLAEELTNEFWLLETSITASIWFLDELCTSSIEYFY